MTNPLDTELYSDGREKYSGYNASIAVRDDDDDMEDAPELNGRRLVAQYTASKEMLNEFAHAAPATPNPNLMTNKYELIA